MSANKERLYEAGVERVQEFVKINQLRPVAIVQEDIRHMFATCGYYRSDVIHIDIPACAHIGVSGQFWSYPGYIVDRTPFGVLAHELGHHVDEAHGSAASRSGMSRKIHELSENEEKLTNYCPNVNEWFAEMFRLFVTNPDLLSLVRPRTYGLLRYRFNVVENRPWDVVLAGGPRQIGAARNKIKEAERLRKKAAQRSLGL